MSLHSNNSLNSLNNQAANAKQTPFSSFASRELTNQSQAAGKNNSTAAESVLLLNAFKQQHLIGPTGNKKQQDALAAALLDANNNRISSVNNNVSNSALSLNSINQTVKNSSLSNSNAVSNKCTSPSTDLNTLASVVNNLFALNSLQSESDSNNNSISCKNQNELLSAGLTAAAGDFLDGNNNSSSTANRNALTGAGLLATASNLGDLNSVLQDCSNHNKLPGNSTAANQGGVNSLGTITKAFDIMAKMASGNSSASSLDSACKNLLVQVDADGGGSNMNVDSEDQQTQSDIDLNSQILEEEQFHFQLTPPSNSSGGAFPNLPDICEYSSKLLFLSVQWVQSIGVFKKFIEQNQIQLLKSCWCDLFILGECRHRDDPKCSFTVNPSVNRHYLSSSPGLSHCSQHMSLSTIVTAIVTQLQTLTLQNKIPMKDAIDYIYKLNKFVNSLQSMQLDDREYAYLKAILLFSEDNLSNSELPITNQQGESKANNVNKLVSGIQSRVVSELNAYIMDRAMNEQEGCERFGKLLLRLMNLKSLSKSITEQLFFSSLIGEVQIDNVIAYKLEMDSHKPNMGEFGSRAERNTGSPAANDKETCSNAGSSPLNQSNNSNSENVATTSTPTNSASSSVASKK